MWIFLLPSNKVKKIATMLCVREREGERQRERERERERERRDTLKEKKVEAGFEGKEPPPSWKQE